MPTSIDQFMSFLDEKTKGSGCPVCHGKNWTCHTEPGGNVFDARVLDQTFVKELNDAFSGKAESSDSGKSESENSFLYSVIIAKCNCCGLVLTFNKPTVERLMNGGH